MVKADANKSDIHDYMISSFADILQEKGIIKSDECIGKTQQKLCSPEREKMIHEYVYVEYVCL
jgi:hypothetical protein